MTNPLFRDPNGNFSASKFWTNVAYATATYVVIMNANATNWELLLVYVATVGGSEVAKKFLNMRYAGSNPASPTPAAPPAPKIPERTEPRL